MQKRILLVLVALCAIGIYKTKTAARRVSPEQAGSMQQAVEASVRALQAKLRGNQEITQQEITALEGAIKQLAVGAPRQAAQQASILTEIKNQLMNRNAQQLQQELQNISQAAARTSNLEQDIRDYRARINSLSAQLQNAIQKNNITESAQLIEILKEEGNMYHSGVAVLLDTLLVASDDPNIGFYNEVSRALIGINNLLRLVGAPQSSIRDEQQVLDAIKNGRSLDHGALEQLTTAFDNQRTQVDQLQQTLKQLNDQHTQLSDEALAVLQELEAERQEKLKNAQEIIRLQDALAKANDEIDQLTKTQAARP